MNSKIPTPVLVDKIKIEAEIIVKSGLHIGKSKEFGSIGTLDSPVIRDAVTDLPIIPGSSLKGKLRTLLVRLCWPEEYERRLNEGVTTSHKDSIPNHDDDPDQIKRLFGSTKPTQVALFQFCDAFLLKESLNNHQEAFDGNWTEIKFENTISRLTSKAEHPRQTERIPAGARFKVIITYDLVTPDLNKLEEDLSLLLKGLVVLQNDYLGGSGTRGYGRVAFENVRLTSLKLGKNRDGWQSDIDSVLEILTNDFNREVGEHALQLLSV